MHAGNTTLTGLTLGSHCCRQLSPACPAVLAAPPSPRKDVPWGHPILPALSLPQLLSSAWLCQGLPRVRRTELTPLPKVTVAVNWDFDFWLFPDGWAELGICAVARRSLL